MSDGAAVGLEDKRFAVTSRCAKPSPAPFNGRAGGAEALKNIRSIVGSSSARAARTTNSFACLPPGRSSTSGVLIRVHTYAYLRQVRRRIG